MPSNANVHPGKLGEVLDMLALASDPGDRADILVSFADRFQEVPPAIAARPFPRHNLVPACESEAYVWAVLQPTGALDLHFAVENPSGVSAKALAAILQFALAGQSPGAVARLSTDVVYDIFRQNISMGKGIGLMSMVRAVTVLARQAARYAQSGGPTPRVFPLPPDSSSPPYLAPTS